MRPEGTVEPGLSALRRAIEQGRHRYPGSGAVLLTTADPHTKLLLENPDLPPASKVLWLLLAHGGTVRRFPAMRELGRLANIRAPATLTTALDALRINRWLTVSEPDRMIEPQVQVLHAPPLHPRLVRDIDPGYPDYLERMRRHTHKRLRMLAQRALQEIPTPETPIPSSGLENEAFAQTRRARRWDFVRKARSPQVPKSQNPMPAPADVATRVPESAPRAMGHTIELIFPERWAPEQIDLAKRYLHSVAPSLRQSLIDEVEGRVAAMARGAPPLYDEVRFMKQLCIAAEAGAFEPNLGGLVRVQREQAARRNAARPPQSVISTKPVQRNEAAAARAFAKIWASLSSDKSG